MREMPVPRQKSSFPLVLAAGRLARGGPDFHQARQKIARGGDQATLSPDRDRAKVQTSSVGRLSLGERRGDQCGSSLEPRRLGELRTRLATDPAWRSKGQ